MALIILTTGSTSPLTVPSDFTVAGHVVNLFGSGGNGAAATTGASSVAGGGGGGGAFTRCVYSSGTITPGSTTIAFLINAGGSANATQWQSSAAGSGAYYEALPGGNAAGATAGGASGATNTVGTPTITYTPTTHTGAAGGAGGGANTLGGGGGGGAGGPSANGGGGGTSTSTGGSGGGGGGAANAGANASTSTGGTGGNGSTGSGGTAGNSGTGSSGGGGGNGGQNTATGKGGNGTDISSDANNFRFGSTVNVGIVGCGGGGGGGGGDTVNQATNSSGGNGGTYGGGGGGQGCVRGTTTGVAGSGSAGIIAISYQSTAWNFEAQRLSQLDPPPSVRNLHRAGALKQQPGFRFFGWLPDGFEQVQTQPPHRPLTSQAYAATKHKSEFAYTFQRAFWGFEEVQTQPPKPMPNRSAGTKGRSEYAIFPFWINDGWEQTQSQPLHRFFHSPEIGSSAADFPITIPPVSAWGFDVQQQYFRKRNILLTVGDVFGIDFPEITFFPSGWQQVFSQDRHPIWRNPDIGDGGIQFPLIQFFPDGWEQTAALTRKQWFRSPEIGDQGTQFPLVRFFPDGWEQISALTRWQRFKSPEYGDQGTQFPFIQFTALEWPFVPMYQHPRPERFASIAPRDDGIVFPMPAAVPPLVETSPPLLYHRLFKSPEIGDQGIMFPFQFFYPSGWQQTLSQDRHPIWKSPDVGDQGIMFPLVQFFPYGWPQVGPQDRHPRPERFGAIVPRDDGIVLPIPPVTFPWFYQTFSQDKHPAYRSPDVGDQGIQFPLIQFFPYGYPQVGPQDRHPRPERAGAIMFGDLGNQLPLPPVFIPWFENTPPPLLHRFWHSPETGDQGTQFPFQFFYPAGWTQTASQDRHPIYKSPTLGNPVGIDFPLINFFPAGWAQVFSQDKHPVYHSPDIGDTGIEFPFVPPTVFPLGWEQVFSQPVHKFYHSPETGDQGTQFPQINFFPAGWEQVASQPPHRIWKSPTIGDPLGIDFTFARFFPYGWEVQPWQPPHRWVPHRGLYLRGDEGIEAPFIFWLNDGWTQTSSQDKHPRPERAGAIMQGDTGTEFPLVRFFPDGWAQVFTQPRLWPTVRQRGLFLFGDTGTEAPFVPPVAIPWFEFLAPLLRRSARTMAALKGRSAFAYPPTITVPVTPWGFQLTDALTRIGGPWGRWRYGAIMVGDTGIEFPFIPTPIPPFIPPRFPLGQFTIDTVQGYVLGRMPIVNDSWTMIFYVGPGLTTGPVLLTFHKPDGTIHVGDPHFAFIGGPTISQIRINNEIGGQYIVYTFATGELDQVGTWTVSAIANNYFSNTYSFTVINPAQTSFQPH